MGVTSLHGATTPQHHIVGIFQLVLVPTVVVAAGQVLLPHGARISLQHIVSTPPLALNLATEHRRGATTSQSQLVVTHLLVPALVVAMQVLPLFGAKSFQTCTEATSHLAQAPTMLHHLGATASRVGIVETQPHAACPQEHPPHGAMISH